MKWMQNASDNKFEEEVMGEFGDLLLGLADRTQKKGGSLEMAAKHATVQLPTLRIYVA